MRLRGPGPHFDSQDDLEQVPQAQTLKYLEESKTSGHFSVVELVFKACFHVSQYSAFMSFLVYGNSW